MFNKNIQEANNILEKLKVQLQKLEGKEKKIIEKKKDSQKILCCRQNWLLPLLFHATPIPGILYLQHTEPRVLHYCL